MDDIIKNEETKLQNEIGSLQTASRYFVDNKYLAENIRSPQLDNAGMNENNAEPLRKRQLENAELSFEKIQKKSHQSATSESTGTVFGGPAGASHVEHLELMDANNEVTSK